jgi:predicted transcriptional regulator
VIEYEGAQRPLFADAPTSGNALLLSIQPGHAKRIYDGTKLYELRKSLPRAPFPRVYLYESGTGLVSGCFDVAHLVEEPVQELWHTVGEAGTTRERFFSYFANTRVGFALAVCAPQKFRVPFPADALRRLDARFRVPVSYLLLREHDPALSALERKRTEELAGSSPLVRLLPISDAERPVFISAVTALVSQNYADITEDFARRILQVHDAGYDETGFLTTGKQVLSAYSEGGALLGFTTVTFKSGGSFKTGPTLLLPQFQGRGYGLGLRFALEEYTLGKGGRKLYCTCPDNSRAVIKNLITCGYRVEAHLSRHYSLDHSEFIFGKVLAAGPPPRDICFRRNASRAGAVVSAADLPRGAAARFIWKHLPGVAAKVPLKSVQRLLDGASEELEPQHYEAKPRRLLLLRSGGECVGAAMLIAKRGGCMKLVLLVETAHTPTIEKLLFAAEHAALRASARKIYCTHPALDTAVVQLLFNRSYVSEGVLRQPYRPGVDTLVLTRYLLP